MARPSPYIVAGEFYQYFAEADSPSWGELDEESQHPFIRAIKALVDDGTIVVVDPDEKHLIQFAAEHHTLQHPLTCRVSGDLFDCKVNIASNRLPASPCREGTYPCDLDPEGFIRIYVPPEAIDYEDPEPPSLRFPVRIVRVDRMTA